MNRPHTSITIQSPVHICPSSGKECEVAGIKNKKAKASITVEASIVCPVFIFAIMALIRIIAWFDQAEEVQRELYNRAGILEKTGISAENIDLPYMYRVDVNLPLPGLYKPVVCQHIVSRAFVGVSSIGGEEEGEIVYVTAKGSVFHRSDVCPYLKSDIYKISGKRVESERNKSGGKYYPCENCSQESGYETVYVTLYGNRYHSDENCVFIKKNVMTVLREDVPGLRPCSKCGGI